MRRNLNQAELQYIDEFIFSRGIHYYDLIQELRDHIASRIEQDEESSFDESMFEITQEFTSDEMDKILRAKTKSLERKWRNRFWRHLGAYFTFPKVLLTISLTISIILLSEWITPVLICAVIGITDGVSYNKRKKIDFTSLLITKTFRRQIIVFYLFPILYFLFGFTPLHLSEGGLNIGLITYGITCSLILISQWACHRHYYTWLDEEIQNNYPEYLNKAT